METRGLKGSDLVPGERAQVIRELRQYLYRVRQVYSHSYTSQLPKRWWPALALLDDMQSHLPFLIEYLQMLSEQGEQIEAEELEWPESLIEWEQSHGRPVSAPRAFTSKQKREIWFRAGGRCCICRVPLEANWHADHRHPWARGGKTEVENGQALCPACNQRKHAKILTVDGESK